ncbi:hypothetical protein [Hydrogenimonas sp.]
MDEIPSTGITHSRPHQKITKTISLFLSQRFDEGVAKTTSGRANKERGKSTPPTG